jgi:hypothetical protein
MNEDVADGMVIDLRGVDMICLLTDPAGAEMKTALDRLLISNANGNNGFSNSIGLSGSVPANYPHQGNWCNFGLPDRCSSQVKCESAW